MTRRMVVWAVARGIRKLRGHGLGEFRHAFDHRFAAHSEEWRRDVWRDAAEKAATR